MVSKKQAEAIGEALAQGNRNRQKSPPYQLRLYPELEKIPLNDRDSALSDAKSRAYRSAPVIVASLLIPAVFVAMYFSYEPESPWIGPFLTAVAAASSVWGFAFRWCVRRRLLRSDWRPSSKLLSEVARASSDE